jgi:hypothetical protein
MLPVDIAWQIAAVMPLPAYAQKSDAFVHERSLNMKHIVPRL